MPIGAMQVLFHPRGGEEPADVFLIRDDFTTTEVAPMTTPRTAEPGPGTPTIVDTGELLHIDATQLLMGATGSGDPRLFYGSIARVAGVAFVMRVNRNGSAGHRAGLDTANSGQPNDVAMTIAAAALLLTGSGNVSTTITLAASATNMFFILRATGAFYIQNDTLIWIDDAATVTPLFFGAGGQFAFAPETEYDFMRAMDLPANGYTIWDADGIITDTLAGARAPGDTFTHEADCHIKFTMTTLPSSGQIEVFFRIQDATNFWQATIDSSGDIDLDEVVAGTPTQRGTSAGTISNGERVTVRCNDETIEIWGAGTRLINYASAANFKTETAGELDTEGTGGSVSDIDTWPLTMAGDAKIGLDAMVVA